MGFVCDLKRFVPPERTRTASGHQDVLRVIRNHFSQSAVVDGSVAILITDELEFSDQYGDVPEGYEHLLKVRPPGRQNPDLPK